MSRVEKSAKPASLGPTSLRRVQMTASNARRANSWEHWVRIPLRPARHALQGLNLHLAARPLPIAHAWPATPGLLVGSAWNVLRENTRRAWAKTSASTAQMGTPRLQAALHRMLALRYAVPGRSGRMVDRVIAVKKAHTRQPQALKVAKGCVLTTPIRPLAVPLQPIASVTL